MQNAKRLLTSGFVTRPEICHRLGISSKTLSKWVSSRKFPPPRYGTGKGQRWLASDLTGFSAEKEVAE